MSKHAYNNTGQQKTVFSTESTPRLYNEKFQGSTELLSEPEKVQLKKSSFELVVARS
jgi:hypothetical protein